MQFIKVPSPLTIKRSPHWPALRRKWLKEHNTCAACGKTVKLAVHHKIPLHIDATKELDETNLITLCENSRSFFCHFSQGHLGNWMKYDANIDEDAAIILKMRQNAAG